MRTTIASCVLVAAAALLATPTISVAQTPMGDAPICLKSASGSTSCVYRTMAACEQAKLPGRTGWVTGSLSNTLASDLIPGFNLSLTHDLWDGLVGYLRKKGYSDEEVTQRRAWLAVRWTRLPNPISRICDSRSTISQ